MNPTPHANAESTEAVAKPAPVTKEQFLKWVSELEGCNWAINDPITPEEGKRATDRAIELEALIGSAPFEFDDDGNLIDAAQPTPSGPTVGDSMDVHYAELKAECERLATELDTMKATKAKNDAECERIAREVTAECVAEMAVEDQLRTALTAAETKAGAMEDALRLCADAIREAMDDKSWGTLEGRFEKAVQADLIDAEKAARPFLPPTPTPAQSREEAAVCPTCKGRGRMPGVGGSVPCDRCDQPSGEGSAHNPDGLTADQIGDGWRLLDREEFIKLGDEHYDPELKVHWWPSHIRQRARNHNNTIRRRIAPPAGTGGAA